MSHWRLSTPLLSRLTEGGHKATAWRRLTVRRQREKCADSTHASRAHAHRERTCAERARAPRAHTCRERTHGMGGRTKSARNRRSSRCGSASCSCMWVAVVMLGCGRFDITAVRQCPQGPNSIVSSTICNIHLVHVCRPLTLKVLSRTIDTMPTVISGSC